jgi:predicted O-methyltransferase YrrM
VGYSAMVWSHAVGPGGKVTGLEYNAEYAKMAENALEERGIKNVQVILGDALET